MKISVIIPVFNRPQLIKRAIDSVLNQSRKADEIIVVNDGSTDNTKEVITEYKNAVCLIDQENMGVSAARNTGIRSAKYEWLAFLDSDDEWHRDKLLKAEEFHEKNPEYGIFQSDEIWFRNGRRVNPRIKHQKIGGWIYKQSLPLCIVSPSAVVINKDIFEDAGLFDEEFIVCEDYDLWLRITRKYPVGFNPFKGVIKYGGHPDQLSKKYWGMDIYRVQAMEKQLNDPSLQGDMRQWTLDEIITKLEILINGFRKRNKRKTDLEEKYNKYFNELSRISPGCAPDKPADKNG
ncbi:MAG: glycosyltransferase family A protein [Calditrichaceae bacterium]|jgi:glycosyltransferase involved in cell wall biosynthesis